MKTPEISRMLQIMVAAGWSRREIVRLCHELSTLPIDVLEDAIEESLHLHKVFDNQLSDRLSGYYSSASFHPVAAMESYSDSLHYSSSNIMNSDLFYKVKQLLIDDLGLSSDEVVRLISQNVSAGIYVPPLSKKSLSNWLDRLSAHVAPSEILYIATGIYNQFKNKKGLDWNVRREK